MALKVGELFASFKLDTSELGKSISSAEKQLQNIGTGLSIGGAALTAAVTKPIVGVFQDIYKTGSTFDAQMSRVFAIAGSSLAGEAKTVEEAEANTQRAMANLTDKAMEMGAKTKFSATEAGEAMMYMAMAGWKEDQMLAGIAPIMDLAAASGENLGTVSDIVTDALTAFGLGADDAGHFADVLAAASSNSNTNVALMGETFKYAAPLAGTLGYKVDDVAAAIGLMANAGIKGSMAGTSLRQILSNMISPTESQAEAMQLLGLSLTDANGKYKSFGELMGDMRAAAKSGGVDMKAIEAQVKVLDSQLDSGIITQEAYDASIQAMTAGSGDFMKAVSDLAGARGLSGFLAIMNATDEDFAKLTGAIENCDDAASKMAGTSLDNAAGSVTILKSTLETLKITLWNLEKDGFNNVVKDATTFVASLTKMDKATLHGGVRMAALTAAIGPVMMGMGGMIKMLPLLTKGIIGLSSPIGLLGIGVVSLIAAAVDSKDEIPKAFSKMSGAATGKLSDFAKDLEKNKKKIGMRAGKFFQDMAIYMSRDLPVLIGSVNSMLTDVMDILTSKMNIFGPRARQIIRTIGKSLAEAAPSFIGSAVDLVTALTGQFIRSLPTLISTGAELAQAIVDGLFAIDWAAQGTSIHDSIVKALGSLHGWLQTFLFGENETDETHTWEEMGEALVEKLREGITNGIGSVRDFIGGLLLGEGYIPEDSWADFGQKLINAIFDGAEGGVDGAGSFVSGILTGISGLFTDEELDKAFSTFSGLAGTILERTIAAIPTLEGKAGEILAKLGELIMGGDDSKGLAAGVLDGASQLVTAIFDAISQALDQDSTDGTAVGVSLLNTLAKVFSAANIQRVTGSLTGLIRNILSRTAELIPKLGTEAAAIITAIGNALFGEGDDGGLVGSGVDALGDILTAILEGAAQIIPTLAPTAATILTAISDALFGRTETGEFKNQGAMQAVTDMISSVLGALPDIIRSLGTGAADILKAIGDTLFEEKNGQKSLVQAATDNLTTGLTAIFEALPEIIGSIGDVGVDILSAIGRTLFGEGENPGLVKSGLEALTTIVKGVFDEMPGVVSSLGASVGNILTAIAGLFTKENMVNLGTGLGDLGAAIITGLGDTIASIFDTVAELAAGAAEDLSGDDNPISAVSAGLESFFSRIVESLAATLPKLVTSGGGLLQAFGKLAGAIVQGLVNALTGIGEKAEGKVDLSQDAGTILSAIISSLNEAAAGLGSEMAGLLNSLGASLFGEDGGLAASALEGAKNMAVSIAGALAQGIRDNHQAMKDSGLQEAVFGLLSGIFENAPSAIDAVTGAATGAAGIASAIFESIADSLGDFEKSKAGTSLRSLADKLPQTIFGAIGDLTGSAEVNGFLINLGNAIGNGAAVAGEAAGEFIGGLLKLLFTPEGWVQIYDTGKSMVKFLINGMFAGLEGIGGLVEGLIDGILDSLGIIDLEERNKYGDMRELLIQSVFGEDGGKLTGVEANTVEGFMAALTAAVTGDTDSLFTNGSESLQAAFQKLDYSRWTKGMTGGEIEQAFKDAGFTIPENLPEGIWDGIAGMFENGLDQHTDVFAALLATWFQTDPNDIDPATVGEGAAEAAKETAETVTEQATSEYERLFGESGTGMAEAAASASQQGMEGFATGAEAGLSASQVRIAAVQDQLVQDFLLSLSAANGATLGSGWMQGILTGMEGYDYGAFMIGQNFGNGFVLGIESMIGAAGDAARRMGEAAGDALSAATQEGSPSKWTRSIGGNFDLGFIEGVKELTVDAADAATQLGLVAGGSLNDTLAAFGRKVNDSTQFPYHRSARTPLGGGNITGSGLDAIQWATAVGQALNGVQVNMDGQPVGELTAPTVSGEIARKSGRRREAVV